MHNRGKGVVLSYLNTAVNMVSGVVLSSVLLRELGDTEYGIYQTVASFANYLVLLEFGMGSVMVRNVSVCRSRRCRDEELEKNVSTIWWLTVLLSVVIAAVSVVFYLLIPTIYANSMTMEQTRYAQKIFVIITGYLVCYFLLQTLNSLILAFENYSYKSVQSILRTCARLAALLVLVYIWPSSAVIAVVDLVLSFICLVVSYLYCRKRIRVRFHPGLCDKAIVRSIVPLALAIFLQSVTNQVNSNVDKFLIGVLLTPESVALYSVPMYIYSIFDTLTSIPVSMYAPSVVQKAGQGVAGEAMADYVHKPCRLTALTGGLVLFGFVAVGRQFIELLYGEKYLLAWPIAIILMVPVYLNSVGGVLINVLDVLNKRMVASAAVAVSTVLNIVMTVFWLDWWGLIGAAMATAVCTTLGQVLFLSWYYDRRLGLPMLRLYGNAFRGVLLPLAVGCAVAYWLGGLFSHVLVSFLISGVVFVGIAAAGYLYFGATEGEKAALRRVLKR